MREPGGKRDLIGTEATRLFVEHGVDAVSVRDIATACDMQASNLYAHFRLKDALVAGCSTKATPNTAPWSPMPSRERAVPQAAGSRDPRHLPSA